MIAIGGVIVCTPKVQIFENANNSDRVQVSF